MEFNFEIALSVVSSSEQYPISGIEAAQWLGKESKNWRNFQNQIIKYLKEGIDYTITQTVQGTAQFIQNIRISKKGFKHLAAIQSDELGYQVREYYFDAEEAYQKQQSHQPQLPAPTTKELLSSYAEELDLIEDLYRRLDLPKSPILKAHYAQRIQEALNSDRPLIPAETDRHVLVAVRAGELGYRLRDKEDSALGNHVARLITHTGKEPNGRYMCKTYLLDDELDQTICNYLDSRNCPRREILQD
jgi:phage anti-repressor protein